MNIVLVFLGGGIGSVLRYLIGIGVQRFNLTLPLATFISNCLACVVFALALFYMSTKSGSSQHLRLLLLTGFCGGLSTFSTFGYETYLLLSKHDYLYAFANILFSVSVCLLLFYFFKTPLTH